MPRRPRNVSRRIHEQRFRRYSQWIADDVADFLAERLPLGTTRSRRVLAAMRRRMEEAIDQNPGVPFDELRDEVTTLAEAIAQTEDTEEATILRALVSP